MLKIVTHAIHLPRVNDPVVRCQVHGHEESGWITELLADTYRADADDARWELPGLVGNVVEGELRAWVESHR